MGLAATTTKVLSGGGLRYDDKARDGSGNDGGNYGDGYTVMVEKGGEGAEADPPPSGKPRPTVPPLMKAEAIRATVEEARPTVPASRKPRPRS
ncbi:hypothetical protein E2562_023041 [Oryza meyeriana var. granulata]|uniref:Uncharacterized protein n=1 Tax=Oryza meyeriana var. granulata TaxID=110450 RepID=A0A6G1EYH8_9ORYZ|nr:hypothetical protein E2562_023041 [Oryza meyeriana var. granulata]